MSKVHTTAVHEVLKCATMGRCESCDALCAQLLALGAQSAQLKEFADVWTCARNSFVSEHGELDLRKICCSGYVRSLT